MKLGIYIGLIFFLFSCKQNLTPEFRNVDGLKIEKVTGKEIILTGNALIYNPAPIGHTIDSAEIEVEMEGINLGVVEQDIKTKLEAKGETAIPLRLKFNLKNLKGSGWVGKAIGIAASGQADIKLNGKIFMSIKGAKVPLPINYEDKVYLKNYVE